MPRHADGLRAAAGPARAGAGEGVQAPRRHRHPLSGLRVAGAGAGAGPRAALRRRHALLGQPHTERFHQFLALLAQDPSTITYLEFRADYHVELRFADGRIKEIPFLQLPISKLPGDFFPLTCRTCVDYTNVLSDITVGYMAGQGEQWLLVRNERGEELLELLGDEVRTEAPGSAGKRRGPVTGFLNNVQRAAGGLPLRRLPDWLRPLVGWLMPRVGPRGLEFARARVEMKAAETVVHLRREQPRRLKTMVPAHIWALVEPYGLAPSPEELPPDRTAAPP